MVPKWVTPKGRNPEYRSTILVNITQHVTWAVLHCFWALHIFSFFTSVFPVFCLSFLPFSYSFSTSFFILFLLPARESAYVTGNESNFSPFMTVMFPIRLETRQETKLYEYKIIEFGRLLSNPCPLESQLQTSTLDWSERLASSPSQSGRCGEY